MENRNGKARSAGAGGNRAPTDGGPGTNTLFIHSGFRASSTWFWSKFRPHREVLSFYEPFNEQLADLTLDNIAEAKPAGWRSHHPQGAPYALEYGGLLGDQPGVPGFPAGGDLGDRYIPQAGLQGPLDEDDDAYIAGLIAHARQLGRIPLLAETRTLGRVHALRQAFGGYHVLLVRNLFQQWNSYAGQARFGNWYFIHTLFETLRLGERDPFIAYLRSFFPEDSSRDFQTWVDHANFDRIFCYFIGFHLYFLTRARRSADMLVDANALAAPDGRHRAEVAAAIRQLCGIELDLADAREQVDFPIFPIADIEACALVIDGMAGRIKGLAGTDNKEARFVDDLLAAMWGSARSFRRDTAGALEYIGTVEARAARERQEFELRLAAEREEAATQFAERIVTLEGERGRQGAEIEVLRGELEVSRAELTSTLAGLAKLEAETASLCEQHRKELDAAVEALRHKTERNKATTTELTFCQTLLTDAEGRAVESAALARRLEAEAADLRETITSGQMTTANLMASVNRLERMLANVESCNLQLAGELRQAKGEQRKLELALDHERAKVLQSAQRIEAAFASPDARERLGHVLAAASQPQIRLPRALRNRLQNAVRRRLEALPGLPPLLTQAQAGEADDPLLEALWRLLAQGPSAS